MIDEMWKTDALVAALKESLPFQANLTPSLMGMLGKKSPESAIPMRSDVTTIQYSGDAGGILCGLDFGQTDAKTVHLVSITHLTFNRIFPLYREIDAYQRHRIKKLKQQTSRGS